MARWLNERRVYQNYVTGAWSPFYAEACAGVQRLTLNPQFYCAPPHAKWTVDPFLEVATVHPRQLARVKEVRARRCEKLTTLIREIKATIVNVWRPASAHVVFHSSGYDSRILSGCLRELARERGRDWLGQVLFLSNRWEADVFFEIMKRQGWQAEQYAAYVEGPPDEHYRIALDFETFWYKHNAPVPMPGRFWWYLVEWAQGKLMLPERFEDMQFFNGQFTRSILKPGSALAEHIAYMDWEYYSETEIASRNGATENSVLCTANVAEWAWGYVGKARRPLKRALADLIAPECKDLPNLHLHDHAAPIARSLLAECKAAFDASWYAQALGVEWEPPETAAIDPRWGVWGLASLCEHLVEAGVEIEVEREIERGIEAGGGRYYG